MDGQKVLQENKTCVYVVENTGIPSLQVRYDGSGTRGGAGDVTGEIDDTKETQQRDEDNLYWLVTPFLIGSFTVIILYFVVNCIYFQYYVKRKIRRMAKSNTSVPTLIFSDGPSSSSVYTPVVKYDGAYGKTDISDTHLIVYQRSDTKESPSSEPVSRQSSFLHLPSMMNHGISMQSIYSANVNFGQDPEPAKPSNVDSFLQLPKRIKRHFSSHNISSSNTSTGPANHINTPTICVVPASDNTIKDEFCPVSDGKTRQQPSCKNNE